jgi:hypothetical protein
MQSLRDDGFAKWNARMAGGTQGKEKNLTT